MPWKEVLPMQERMRFVTEAQLGHCSFVELCQSYGISRKTGYKWCRRYEEEGVEGLPERSRCPHHKPSKVTVEVAQRLVELRRRHRSWGPKKLVRLLFEEGFDAPAPSTAGEILRRAGLTKPRKRRRNAVRTWACTLTQPRFPNHVWTVDFKGWFRLKEGTQCHPLTVMDLHSRYLLCLKGQESIKMAPTMESFERLFAARNVPKIIRVDNGLPFGGRNAFGLSRLSLNWLRRGIQVEFIDAGRPDQNGSHERMHRTLKNEATLPPSSTMHAQQKRFDKWRNEYNKLRPHESLGQKPPADLYSPSRFTGQPCSVEYPAHYEIRKVNNNGEIHFDGNCYFISEIFRGESLGLKRVKDEAVEVYTGGLCLGVLNPGRHDGLDSTNFRLGKV